MTSQKYLPTQNTNVEPNHNSNDNQKVT